MAQIKYNLGDLGTEVYSTNETVIGTWIDGKPIYRKVIYNNDATKYSLGKDNTVNIPVVNANGTGELIKYDVYASDASTNNSMLSISQYCKEWGNSFWTYFSKADGNLYIRSLANNNYYYIRIVIVEYTKSN